MMGMLTKPAIILQLAGIWAAAIAGISNPIIAAVFSFAAVMLFFQKESGLIKSMIFNDDSEGRSGGPFQ